MQYTKLLSSDMIGNTYNLKTVRKTLAHTSGTHFHDFFEIELILSGEGRHMMNGNTYSIKRGSVFLLTPTDFHKLTPENSLDILTIMFDDEIISEKFLENVLTKKENLCFTIEEDDVIRIDFLANILMREELVRDEYSRGCIKNILEYILSVILRYNKKEGIHQSESEYEPFDRALKFIYAHVRDTPSLPQAASVAGYSPNYFSKVFTEKMNMSYTDFLNRQKIKLAKMLLLSTNKTSSEIGFACGFNTPSNFYRVFSESEKVSPLQYRKTHKLST